jgi:hypothetical protein
MYSKVVAGSAGFVPGASEPLFEFYKWEEAYPPTFWLWNTKKKSTRQLALKYTLRLWYNFDLGA